MSLWWIDGWLAGWLAVREHRERKSDGLLLVGMLLLLELQQRPLHVSDALLDVRVLVDDRIELRSDTLVRVDLGRRVLQAGLGSLQLGVERSLDLLERQHALLGVGLLHDLVLEHSANARSGKLVVRELSSIEVTARLAHLSFSRTVLQRSTSHSVVISC